MKRMCPNCEKETDVEKVSRKETIEVRGEPIEIQAEYLVCKNCNEDFLDKESTHDPLELAYVQYRKRHGMVQPEDIVNFRKRYGLTQGALCKLLGWGLATLSRYENGALQDEAHDTTLRLAMDPHSLHTLVGQNTEALSKEKRERLLQELQNEEDESMSIMRVLESMASRLKPDIYSGYKRFDSAKLINAILFFCRDGVLKTKLNKLLFYADFKHFKQYTVSITGARYVHLPYGPVPDNYDFYFAEIVQKQAITIEEEVYTDCVGEKLLTKMQPDLSLFSDSELKILSTVKEFFADYTATKISSFSHEEKAYKNTSSGDIISYEYAEQLQI